MTPAQTIECPIHIRRQARGHKALCAGPAPLCPSAPRGRVPRITRLLALAIRFEGLLRQGVVKDYAELARLGRVSRARISQIANLTLLAPDIQEIILFLPRTQHGRDRICLGHLQPIALEPDWREQRQRWAALLGLNRQQGGLSTEARQNCHNALEHQVSNSHPGASSWGTQNSEPDRRLHVRRLRQAGCRG
jgi:hypothetical protein